MFETVVDKSVITCSFNYCKSKSTYLDMHDKDVETLISSNNKY